MTKQANQSSDREILLSGSVPEKYRSGLLTRPEFLDLPGGSTPINEAVIGLTAAILARQSQGCKLVFGGHPAITPLVAQVATDQFAVKKWSHGIEETPRPAPIVVYQANAFRDRVVAEAKYLEDRSVASFEWLGPNLGEGKTPQDAELTGLKMMRAAMVGRKSVAGMIAVAGMEGVEIEVKLFSDCWNGKKPILFLVEVGGAASLIAAENLPGTVIVDRRFLVQILGPGFKRFQDEPVADLPWGFVMDGLVEWLLGSRQALVS